MFAGLKVSSVSVTALLMRRILSPVRRLNTRTKVVSGIVLVTLCTVVAALNVNPLLTIGAIGLATATLYSVIVASGGLEVGELPDRQSRVVPLVTASQTSAGGKALLVEATRSL